jgi:opacity protein-like surface antigen
MKKFLVIIVCIALLTPAYALAFDGNHRGFLLGLGLGFGSAKQTVSSGGASVSNTESGVATSLKIGGGINDQVLLYYSNRVVFYSTNGATDHSFYQGMSAAACTYYLEPVGPSFFFSGELGIGVIRDRDSDDDASDTGFGFGLGAGYEFSPHFSVEGSFMHATVGSENIDGHDVDFSINNFTVTANWLGF